MRHLICFSLIVLSSCSYSPNYEPEKISLYKEAFWKSKRVINIDSNVDHENPAALDFNLDFQGQLIELNLKTSKLGTFIYTLNNNSQNDESSKHQVPNVMLANLRVEINDQDVTDCLITECNEVKCTASQKSLTSFSGLTSTSRIYLNLAKLDNSNSSQCSDLVLHFNGMNKITFRELNLGAPGKKTGGRVNAQVIVYNRPYKISDIRNVFNLGKASYESSN